MEPIEPTQSEKVRTLLHLAAVEVRHQTWRALLEQTDAAEEQLAQALTDANDAGVTYRELATVLPWSYGYVGQLIRAHRERQEVDA